MIPFPGESVAIANAAHITSGGIDWGVFLDVVYRAGSVPGITAGEELRAWAYAEETYHLEPGTDVEVSWVVEFLAGTAGTVTASWGLDPSYGDPDAATPNALGTHAVSGVTTLVLPTTLTGADILTDADAAFAFRLACDSGTLDVQQIKLRVWPPGGPVGGWVTQPGWDESTYSAVLPSVWAGSSTAEADGTGSTSEESWDNTAPDLAGPPLVISGFVTPALDNNGPGTESWVISALSNFTAVATTTSVTPPVVSTGINLSSVAILLVGRDWQTRWPIEPTLVWGVDYVIPPNEVNNDIDGAAQLLGEGGTGWMNANARMAVNGHQIPLGSAEVRAESVPIGDGGGTYEVPSLSGGVALPDPPPLSTVYGDVTLPTDDRSILVVLTHSALQIPPDWPGNTSSAIGGPQVGQSVRANFGVGDDVDFAPLKTFAVMPAYRIWSPTAVETTAHPLRLMQRGDGLGMGSGRALSTGTRQASTRLFGSL